MKSLIIFGMLGFLLGSCAKPPAYPGVKKPDSLNGDAGSTINQDPEEEGGPGSDPGGSSPLDPDSSPYLNLACANADTHRGLRNWRRLSQIEMINTVKDVFQLPESVSLNQITNDIPKLIPFDTVAAPETNMDLNRLKNYVRFAETVSQGLNLMKFFPCLAEKEKCVQQKTAELATLAWRRPALADEVSKLVDLFKGLSEDGVPNELAFRNVIEAIILSPNFMYRTELGIKNAEGDYVLSSWELASALSYMLTRHPPDLNLRDLASKDLLRNPATLKAQAERLLADPKSKEGMRDFAALWFSSDKITNIEKAAKVFNDDVKTKLKEELENNFVHTMFDAQNKTYKQLMSADYTVGDKAVGFVYSAQPDAEGKIKFAQAGRRGLLGLGGFLAAYTFGDLPNPITRGVFISERFLCTDFAMPPAVMIPQPKEGQSSRERFKMHSNFEPCAICHVTIDNLGFATDNFGSNGEYRTMDGTELIALNQKIELDGVMAKLTKPQDLSNALANSKEAEACFVRQAFRYSIGRLEYGDHKVLGAKPEFTETDQTKLDQCQVDTALEAMNRDGGSLKSAFLSFITDPAFRIRVPNKKDPNGLMLLDHDFKNSAH